MTTEPKKETISDKEFKAEEAEREKRFKAMLKRITCVIFVFPRSIFVSQTPARPDPYSLPPRLKDPPGPAPTFHFFFFFGTYVSYSIYFNNFRPTLSILYSFPPSRVVIILTGFLPTHHKQTHPHHTTTNRTARRRRLTSASVR